MRGSLRSSSCLGRKPPRAPQLEETPETPPSSCSISEPVHPNRSRAQLTCLLFVRTTVLEALIVANNKALCLLPCFLQFILSLPAPQLSFAAAAAAKSLQSGPTLSDPIDGSPPGSPVPGILQASLASQRHPGKFPKVPGRRRGTRGFPAAPRQRPRPPTRRVPPRGTPRVPAPLPLSPFSPPDRDRTPQEA